MGVGIFVGGIQNINALADSKAHLADLVMEHETKISTLEQQLKELQARSTNSNTLSDQVKQALLKEINQNSPTTWNDWNNPDNQLVISKYDVVEKNRNVVIQVFTEGNADWTETRVNGTQNLGRQLSWWVIGYCDTLSKLYGLNDVVYEFYQNGERVKVSTSL